MSILKKIVLSSVFAFTFLVASFSTSHAAMLLFKGKGFFMMNLAMDISNILVNPYGKGQPMLTSASFLKLDLYPILEDKQYKTELKIKINPYATGTDYLIADGFNFIYDTETMGVALYVNRFGFRFNDPMFTGIDNYLWEYSSYAYDKPVYFSFNKKVHTPAYYDGETDNRFMKLGNGLTGLYLAGKGDFSYELAAYLNKAQTSSHIQFDVAYDFNPVHIGLIARMDNHPNDDTAVAAAYNLANIHNGLVQRCDVGFVLYSAGLFGNVNFADMMNLFFEGVYRTGTGMPGFATNTSKNGVIDVYVGVGTDILPGTDLELSALYRMNTPGSDNRMDINLKDYNELDFGGVQLFLLANVNFFAAKVSSQDASGLSVSLSGRIPMFDMIDLRIAGAFSSYTVSTNSASDLVVKATVDYWFDDTTKVYAGIVMYNLMSTLLYKVYEPSYFLPVVGFVSSPFESLSLSVTFGFDVETFTYDNSGGNMENIVSTSYQTVTVGTENQAYVQDWLKMVANPSLNFNATITF